MILIADNAANLGRYAKRKRPADFDTVAMTMNAKELGSHYRKSTYTIRQWFLEIPEDVRAARDAIMFERQKSAGKEGFKGAQKMRFERDEAQSLQRHLKKASDDFVAAYRAAAAKTGWPVRGHWA